MLLRPFQILRVCIHSSALPKTTKHLLTQDVMQSEFELLILVRSKQISIREMDIANTKIENDGNVEVTFFLLSIYDGRGFVSTEKYRLIMCVHLSFW